MRWSIEELIFAWRIYKEYNLWSWIARLPRNTYHRIKLLWKWIFTGKTDQVLWDLDRYLQYVILNKLRDFKKQKRYGYPYELNSQEEWEAVLDEMIDAWDKMLKDHYINQIPDLEPLVESIEIDGKEYSSVSFPKSQERFAKVDELVNLQKENNEKAMKLFTEYFHNLWD